MGRPAIYRLADGTRVPSVTTILKTIGEDNDGLLRWANKLGLEGRDLDEGRDAAANVGTVAHAMIEADIKGQQLDLMGLDPSMLEKARQAHASWKDWAKRTEFTPIVSEHPMVSEALRFGGTPDCVAIDRQRTIVDWKVTGSIYPKHVVQLAAYGILWNECRPDEPLEGYAILRLERDYPGFAYRLYSDLAVAREAFLQARALYDTMGKVRRAA